MALDRVKPLKLESIDTGGNQNDEFPTSLNPEEDHVECAGIVMDDPDNIDETTVIKREEDNMMFTDVRNPDELTLTRLAETGLERAIFKVDGGLVYDNHGNPQVKELP